MNIRVVGAVLFLTASSATAADADASSLPATPTGGLDIYHVVSVTPVPGSCQVEPATMVYVDSQGGRHSVTYQVMGTCQGGYWPGNTAHRSRQV